MKGGATGIEAGNALVMGVFEFSRAAEGGMRGGAGGVREPDGIEERGIAAENEEEGGTAAVVGRRGAAGLKM